MVNLNLSISRPLSGTGRFLAAMPTGVPYSRTGYRAPQRPPRRDCSGGQ